MFNLNESMRYWLYPQPTDARTQRKSQRAFRTPLGEMRPFISGEYASEG
jgi:hypothetical protein